MPSSEDSSPTDFAFEPPLMDSFSDPSSFKTDALKTPNYSNNGTSSFPPSFTPSSGSSFMQQGQTYPGVPAYGYSGNSASSFSSTSGSVGGTSFSSADALPAISRDFVRPSDSETRRPATAGGALQSRSPFGGFINTDGQDRGRSSTVAVEDGKPETIDEGPESLFNTNPFGSPETDETKQMQGNDHLDMGFNSGRRGSEQYQPLSIQTSWENANQGSLGTPEQPQAPEQSPNNTFGLTSAPPHITNFGLLGGVPPQQQNQAQVQQLQRPPSLNYGGRPQTSDGIPSYGALNAGGVSLPSARTIVNQIDPSTGFPTHTHHQQPPQHFYTPQMAPFRDARAASMSEMPGQQFPAHFPSRHYSIATDKATRPGGPGYMAKDGAHQELTFVPLGGPAPKKRPRRRYDEIERLYLCGWNGCEKAYGTLNHLNAHVAMQKHGEKRLPSEFKEMRKQWRKRKREQAAAVANAQYMSANPNWQATARPSISSDSDFARRDSMASIYSQASDYTAPGMQSHRGSMVYAPNYSWAPPNDASRPNTSSSVASSSDGRFGGMMQAPPAMGMGGGYNHSMINPVQAGRRASVPAGHVSLPGPPPPPSHHSGQHQQQTTPNGQQGGDHPTPTQQNPFPDRSGPGSAGPVGGGPGQSFPFQTLTSPMPGGSGDQFGQTFAFQR